MVDGPLVLIEELQAPVEDLWALWTEPDQVATWLAGGSTIDLRVGGSYLLTGHLLSRPLPAPAGGAIVGLEEEYVLKVAWKVPAGLIPGHPQASPVTALTILFQPLGPNRTRIRLEHDGWPSDDAGATALKWHTEAWTEVLSRLKQKSG